MTAHGVEELALTLHRAGVILRHHAHVYLKPEDITAVVSQVSPSSGRQGEEQSQHYSNMNSNGLLTTMVMIISTVLSYNTV